MTSYPFIPTLIPLKTSLDRSRLDAAAAADNHQVVAPTHLVERDGQIVGYVGFGTLVNTWLRSDQVRPRDSLYLLNMVEVVAQQGGSRELFLPVSPQSPFHPIMSKLGYQELGTATLTIKRF